MGTGYSSLSEDACPLRIEPKGAETELKSKIGHLLVILHFKVFGL